MYSGLYNRDYISVRIEDVPADAILKMHAYFEALVRVTSHLDPSVKPHVSRCSSHVMSCHTRSFCCVCAHMLCHASCYVLVPPFTKLLRRIRHPIRSHLFHTLPSPAWWCERERQLCTMDE